MKKQITFIGWNIELSRQGVTVTRVPPDRYREIKVEPVLPAWLQAADAFLPGSWQLAERPVAKQQNRSTGSGKAGRKARRHSF